MKTIVHSPTTAIASIIFFLLLSPVVALPSESPTAPASQYETWRCFERSGLTKKNKDHSPRETGHVTLTQPIEVTHGYSTVEIAGYTHIASFTVIGINRRWDFGDRGLTTQYAFIIKPNGDGFYYDFSDIEKGEKTPPSQFFVCVSP